MRARRVPLDGEHPAYDPSGVGPDGLAQCRRCLAQLRPGLADFCGPECRHDFLMRVSPAYARAEVFRRDAGVCCHCRLDCGLLDRVLRRIADSGDEGCAAALAVVEALGLGRRRRLISTWQADHRVAVAEGGAGCGLGNYRTLCLACHARETRQLHRRMRASRSPWAAPQ